MHCFGYTFPFRIFCDASVGNWEPIRLKNNGNTITIYPPFVSDAITRRSCPTFDHGKSPALLRRGISSSRRDLGLISIPTFEYDALGKTGVQLVWSDDNAPRDYKILPCSALQIDIDSGTEQTANKLAEHYHAAWLRNIRRLTKQYWIGHFPSYFESSLRVQFSVRDDYSLVEEPYSNAMFTTPNRNTTFLSEELWNASIKNINNSLLPNSLDYLLDGIHLAASGDKYRSIISLAIFIERSKHSIWRDLHNRGIVGKNAYKKIVNDTSKPSYYLNDKLDEIIERNFLREHEDAARIVEAIWVVRGVVAHGRESEIPRKYEWLLGNNEPTRAAGKLFDLIEFTSSIKTSRKLPK